MGGILELEQRLEALRFDPGPVDGVFDQDTRYAVTAFQKVNDMPRTGEATPDVMSAVGSYSGPPAPLAPGGGSNRVEIDLRRQVLFLYQGDTLAKILPISSGNGKRFCSGGSCRKAITPTGRFAVYQQRRGWETSPLGRLYNSQYFVGGYAIHGSHSVPPEPASHGCVRIPMRAAEWFPSQVTIGTPVHVLG